MPDQTMTGRYLAARERAIRMGDAGLLREVDFQLEKIGYRPAATAAEEAEVEARADAASRPRRGRPPARRDQNLPS